MLQSTVYFLVKKIGNALILKGCIFAALLTNALLLPFLSVSPVYCPASGKRKIITLTLH